MPKDTCRIFESVEPPTQVFHTDSDFRGFVLLADVVDEFNQLLMSKFSIAYPSVGCESIKYDWLAKDAIYRRNNRSVHAPHPDFEMEIVMACCETVTDTVAFNRPCRPRGHWPSLGRKLQPADGLDNFILNIRNIS